MDSATERLGSFLQTHAPSMWVACGFGGGLSAELEVGDIVVARNLSDSAPFDAIGPLRARTGTLITTTEVIETALQKKQLASHTGATVVDMETVAIRRLCDARGIPMLAVRAISDAAGQNLPIPSAVWFDAHAQRPRPIPLVLHLAGHPGRILPFARFVRGIGRAHGSLTRFLVAAVPVLAERWK